MFLDSLKQFHNNDNGFYYFDDYIVNITGDEIRFGVERGGHSGGFWFIPQIIEYENKIEFRGEIQFISSVNNTSDNRSRIQKIKDNLLPYLLFIIVLPIVLPLVLINQLKEAIINRSKKKPRKTEDKLHDLLENHLGCTRKTTD